jgi:hypothetical protein
MYLSNNPIPTPGKTMYIANHIIIKLMRLTDCLPQIVTTQVVPLHINTLNITIC